MTSRSKRPPTRLLPLLPNGWQVCRRMGCGGLVMDAVGAVGTMGLFGWSDIETAAIRQSSGLPT